MIVNKNNGNGNGNGYSHYLSWQNIVATATLILLIGGAFWALAYQPVGRDLSELKAEIAEIRRQDAATIENFRKTLIEHDQEDHHTFLTQKEHNEFANRQDKNNIAQDEKLKQMEAQITTLSTNQASVLEYKRIHEADYTRLKDRVLFLERMILGHITNDPKNPPK